MCAAVLVQLVGKPLVTDAENKPHREYVFRLIAGGAQHTLRLRYSALQRALGPFASGDTPWPIDVLSRCKDYVHDKTNVSRRSEELSRFLAGLLNRQTGGAYLADPDLHAALHIRPGTPIHKAFMVVAMLKLTDTASAQRSARLVAIAHAGSKQPEYPAIFAFDMCEGPGDASTDGGDPGEADSGEHNDIKKLFSFDWTSCASERVDDEDTTSSAFYIGEDPKDASTEGGDPGEASSGEHNDIEDEEPFSDSCDWTSCAGGRVDDEDASYRLSSFDEHVEPENVCPLAAPSQPQASPEIASPQVVMSSATWLRTRAVDGSSQADDP